MSILNIILIVLVVLFIVSRMMPAKGVKNITTADLKDDLKDKNKQFIDVRTPGEFKANHIRGFKNIPLQSINENAIKQLSKDKEIVVICQSGMRSNKASKVFKKMGFKQVTNVKGGMSAWT